MTIIMHENLDPGLGLEGSQIIITYCYQPLNVNEWSTSESASTIQENIVCVHLDLASGRETRLRNQFPCQKSSQIIMIYLSICYIHRTGEVGGS
jgi:hypothetical protein